MPEVFSGFGFVLALIVIVLALKSFGINQEYQRGVVFRLGRLMDTKGPGWFLAHSADRAGGEDRPAGDHIFPGDAGNHDARWRRSEDQCGLVVSCS